MTQVISYNFYSYSISMMWLDLQKRDLQLFWIAELMHAPYVKPRNIYSHVKYCMLGDQIFVQCQYYILSLANDHKAHVYCTRLVSSHIL